jgi:hypothetical protein
LDNAERLLLAMLDYCDNLSCKGYLFQVQN